PGGGEVAGVAPGGVGVPADPEAEVEPVRLVAEIDENLPGAERVLPARHGHQHPLPGLDHVEAVDRPPHLLPTVPHAAVGAEGGVVAAHVDQRGGSAAATLHYSAA